MQNDTRKTYFVELKDVLNKEAVGVVPGQENVFKHITYTLLLEAKVICTHHRRVDKVQPMPNKVTLYITLINILHVFATMIIEYGNIVIDIVMKCGKLSFKQIVSHLMASAPYLCTTSMGSG